MSRSQVFFESWRDAEKFQQEYATRNDSTGHHYNKVISQHLDMAKGRDRNTRGRAKEVLRYLVKWREADQSHRELHKNPPTMQDLADQKPSALRAWRHYNRTVAPKERRYHKATWLLLQQQKSST